MHFPPLRAVLAQSHHFIQRSVCRLCLVVSMSFILYTVLICDKRCGGCSWHCRTKLSGSVMVKAAWQVVRRVGFKLCQAHSIPCGETHTMSHVVESCALTKLNCGLSWLHSADEDAVSWLTSYGSWRIREEFICSKNIKIVATRCQISRLNAPNSTSAGVLQQTPLHGKLTSQRFPRHPSWIKGATSKGREGGRK